MLSTIDINGLTYPNCELDFRFMASDIEETLKAVRDVDDIVDDEKEEDDDDDDSDDARSRLGSLGKRMGVGVGVDISLLGGGLQVAPTGRLMSRGCGGDLKLGEDIEEESSAAHPKPQSPIILIELIYFRLQ